MAEALVKVTGRSVQGLRGHEDEFAKSAQDEAVGYESLSVVQAGEEARRFLRAALDGLQEAQRKSDVFPSADSREASLLQTFLAAKAKSAPSAAAADPHGGYEAKFDSKDLVGWGGSLLDWFKKLKPHPFVELATGEGVDAFPDAARVSLLSDWGTGLYGAPVCAKSIEASRTPATAVIHLGDVYYAGDDDEVRDRFLAFWPKVPGAINRALNANHEMYTGGKAYFKRILPPFGQNASYFALQNSNWLVAGLDTGYSEHRLHGNQVQWLKSLVDSAGERKVVLLSHHQPYSLYETQGDELVAQLRPILETRKVAAWYWGHEHRLVIHDAHPQWGLYGRCVGHSGFPYFRDFRDEASHQPILRRRNTRDPSIPSGDVLDGRNRYVTEAPDRYGPNGYVDLEFDGKRLLEHFLAPDGALMKTNTVV